jgi:hypothetical protein
MPVLIDCNFVVDSTNGNGLGIRSLKGPYVQNVFMHTSATPGLGNSNPQTLNFPITNPNPESGIIVVQLQDNFSKVFFGGDTIVSPLGASIGIDSGLTVGNPYVVTVVGDALSADWLNIGVPAGILAANAGLPPLGTAFIAKSTGHGASTLSKVAPPSVSNIDHIETIGDSNQALAPSITAQGFGAQFILQCLDGSNALTAPANGTVISLQFLLSNSSIQIQGE